MPKITSAEGASYKVEKGLTYLPSDVCGGGVEPPSVVGHLGSGEPIVKPTFSRSVLCFCGDYIKKEVIKFSKKYKTQRPHAPGPRSRGDKA